MVWKGPARGACPAGLPDRCGVSSRGCIEDPRGHAQGRAMRPALRVGNVFHHEDSVVLAVAVGERFEDVALDGADVLGVGALPPHSHRPRTDPTHDLADTKQSSLKIEDDSGSHGMGCQTSRRENLRPHVSAVGHVSYLCTLSRSPKIEYSTLVTRQMGGRGQADWVRASFDAATGRRLSSA